MPRTCLNNNLDLDSFLFSDEMFEEFTDENGDTVSFSDLLRLAEEDRNLKALRITAPLLFESGKSEELLKSIKFFEILASEYELCEAIMFLSWYFKETDPELSFKWLKKAADLNYTNAVIQVAHSYQSRFPLSNVSTSSKTCENEDEDDVENLIHYSLLAGKSQDSKSCFYLGQIHEFGFLNCEKSIKKALEFYLLGSDSHCILRASNILMNEKEMNDTSRAIQLIVSSARKFGIPSLKPVADMIMESDPQEAFILYNESSSQGDELSTKIVGDCYYFGIGTESNLESSLEYYECAISLGSNEALLPCLRILWEKKEKSKALQLFQKLINTFMEDQSSFKNLSTVEWYERLENFCNF